MIYKTKEVSVDTGAFFHAHSQYQSKKTSFGNVVMHSVRYLDKMKGKAETKEVCLLF